MDNLDFLKKIIISDCWYWVAAKKEYKSYSSRERLMDSIWIICIPHLFELNKNPDEILLKDIEALRRVDLYNIAITENYFPFQSGQTLCDFYIGFPLEGEIDIKQFIIKAFQLNSVSIHAYEKLFHELLEAKTETTTPQIPTP